MRIGILAQWFDPEPGPASLPGVYAREFITQGHSVSVLTGFPNYPDGRLYDGYRVRRRTREQHGAIDVTRVALIPNHGASVLGRVANYSTFALSATASGRSALRDVDAVWVYNSPVTVGLPLLSHTRNGRTPYFLHVQDLWPDSLIDSGMIPAGWLGDLAAAVANRIVRFTERKATIVGVSSRSLRDIILSRHPALDPAKIVYAPNPTDESLFRPAADLRRELQLSDESPEFVDVMYAGAIGEVQGLDTLLEAAALLKKHSQIRILLVGDGISRERLERQAAAERLWNVRFLGRVPQRDIPECIARSHIQLVSLADTPFLHYTTPSKIATLLASGVPIIGHLAGDGARLIREAEAGVVVTPGDASGLCEAIVRMAQGGTRLWQRHGALGRAYYEAHLSAASTAGEIIRSLSGTATNRVRIGGSN
ncbi:glycosyltransferase involved in cell wall biosynthesis [Agromyces sp. 3263]|uniref:glycosyltransferase family 4 protein n=1 Tax=Agromyces sp. 3263 TaxID=2817750 RepID=UPI002864FF87|nr:glycosyltransferase family 4 protein [Agromyces sp. 3263]MDR6904809.1 glycosyltransferase involved in cell wall biosynthesis [Agromyces sp. 3263]